MSDAPTLSRDAAPAARPGTTPPRARRRRPFLHAFFRALSDPRTFDLRGNPSLWLGMLLATPIPLLVFYLNAPPWLDLVALLAPVGWGLLLGAAGRVALLAEEEARRLASEAEERERLHATAQQTLHAEVASERTQRLVLENELQLAQAIQRTLVPADIVRSDLQVIVRNIPCSFVGGDYLQAYFARPDLLYLCVGDVSGHGIAAALVVNRIHGHVRRLILEQKSPDAFLEELNRSTLKIFRHTYFFLTFAVFRVDLAKRRIDYATAGHPPQFLLRADGKVVALSTPNRLLGMDADVFDSERPVDSVEYAPGDSLVLFTDGLFEILGKESGEMLGETALQQALANVAGLPPSLVVGEVLHDLADFQGTSKFADDVSLMVARFDPVPVPTSPPSEAALAASSR